MQEPGNFRDAKPAATRSDARRIIRYTISVVMGYNFYKLSSDKVFNDYYTTYELGTPNIDRYPYSLAERAYRKKDFAEVSTLAKESKDTLSLLLAGMAQLELKNYSSAAGYYKKVIEANEKAGTRHFKDEAEYYLALSYIADKDFDLSLDLLQKIYDDKGHGYNQKVTRKLLRQVRLLKWR
jgi:tetratricopeptide (TPR) repeat protein